MGKNGNFLDVGALEAWRHTENGDFSESFQISGLILNFVVEMDISGVQNATLVSSGAAPCINTGFIPE